MKRHVQGFDRFRNKKNKVVEKTQQPIKEAVMETGNTLKVITTIDIPVSLVNAYAKKVKDTFDKDVLRFFGRDGVAEELVKWVATNKLSIDQIPAGALTGDEEPQAQTEAQPQVQAQVQPQAQPEVQPETQDETQAQPQAQPEAQPQSDEEGFEEVQPQAQEEVETQFETEDEETEGEETDEEETEGEEELPL